MPGDEPPWAYYQPTGMNGEKTVFLKALPVADETRSFQDPAFLSHKSMLEAIYARAAKTEVFW